MSGPISSSRRRWASSAEPAHVGAAGWHDLTVEHVTDHDRDPLPGEGGAPGSAPSSAEVLRSFGLDVLVEIIETTGYGVCVTGDDHTWVYLNPAGARIIGAPFGELYGRDYLLSFAEHERAALLALEYKQREGDTSFYTNTVVQPDGQQLEMTWSGTVVEIDGVETAPAIFHETSTVRRAQAEAAELGAGAVRMASGGSTADVMSALVAEAVVATRACGALLLLEDAAGWLRVAATAGLPDGMAGAVAASPARLADLPAGDLVLNGRGGFLSDDRERLAENPKTRPWLDAVAALDWRGAAKIPVVGESGVTGCLVVLIPERLTFPSESELAFWRSLAEQAAVALGTHALREQVSHSSALMERERIARDLHDSVNHALFGLQTRAQVIRRALAAGNNDLALEAAADLEELSRQATTEMRGLLSELRPSDDEQAAGLGQALVRLAESVTGRDGLPVRLELPADGLDALPEAAAEHLFRIAGEALHNAVKHADARSADITVTLDSRDVVLTVVDDGRGFDTAVTQSRGHGQRTMRERAALCGGEAHVLSRPGEGTSVVVRLPLARQH